MFLIGTVTKTWHLYYYVRFGLSTFFLKGQCQKLGYLVSLDMLQMWGLDKRKKFTLPLYGTHGCGYASRQCGSGSSFSFQSGSRSKNNTDLSDPDPPPWFKVAWLLCGTGNIFLLVAFERHKESGTRVQYYTESWIHDILVRIRIRASDQWIRMRILLFSFLTFNFSRHSQKTFFVSAYYFFRVHFLRKKVI